MTSLNRWSKQQLCKGHGFDMWRYIEQHPGITSLELKAAFPYVPTRSYHYNLKQLVDQQRIKRVKIGSYNFRYTAEPVLMPDETPPVFRAYDNLKRMQQHARISIGI